MADVTYYVALPFGQCDDGPVAYEAMECRSATAAIRAAERYLGRKDISALWRSAVQAIRTLVNFSDAIVLAKFGDVPDDLSINWRRADFAQQPLISPSQVLGMHRRQQNVTSTASIDLVEEIKTVLLDRLP